MALSFDDRFAELFREHFQRLYRYLVRLSGDAELADDLAQEAFLRLYRRRSSPDTPGAWLAAVATNLFRNARTTRSRRARLIAAVPAEDLVGDPPASPEEGEEAAMCRRRVRSALDRMPDRERRMLLLRAEGYSYREIAAALKVQETSVGTLLARAKVTFRNLYEDRSDAS